MIACAQGASETNISFVVESKSLRKSLNVIHDSFFLSEYQGSIFTFEIKGTEEDAKKFIDNLRVFSLLANVADVKSLSKKYDVKMTLNVEECLNDLSLLDGMQSVFISGVHSHERNIILKYCVGQGINVFVIPRVGDVIMSGAQPMHMFHQGPKVKLFTWWPPW